MSSSTDPNQGVIGPLGFLTLVIAAGFALAFYGGSSPQHEPTHGSLESAPVNTLVSDPTPAPGQADSTATNADGQQPSVVEDQQGPADTDTAVVTGEGSELSEKTDETTEMEQESDSLTVASNQDSADTGNQDSAAASSQSTEVEASQPAQTVTESESTGNGTVAVATIGAQVVSSAATEPMKQSNESNEPDLMPESEATATAASAFVESEAARLLADTARNLFAGVNPVDAETGSIMDSAKTGLIEIIDSMRQNPGLAAGIASRLDDTLGMESFQAVNKYATAIKTFFVDNGVEGTRIVSGVLAPDYVSENGIIEQISFFFAEKQ